MKGESYDWYKTSKIVNGDVFLDGFWTWGLSLHYAQAQGLLGVTDSVKQLGTSLNDMQKNVSDLQKNMDTIKQVKDKLSNMDNLKKEGESLKGFIPGLGQ